MQNFYSKTRLLSNNALKIIGMLAMVLDHVGAILLPNVKLLRIIGRLAFPIFAFMIAEGARYTKNKARYLGILSLFALVIQLVYSLYDKHARLCILVTFTFSVILIYALDFLKKQILKENINFWLLILSGFLFLGLSIIIYIVTRKKFVDYSFAGVLTPVLVSVFHFDEKVNSKIKKLDNHLVSLFMLAIGLILVYYSMRWYQLYALLSLPLLFFYSGKRGKYKMKYFFYLFYPIHLLILEDIRLIIK